MSSGKLQRVLKPTQLHPGNLARREGRLRQTQVNNGGSRWAVQSDGDMAAYRILVEFIIYEEAG